MWMVTLSAVLHERLTRTKSVLLSFLSTDSIRYSLPSRVNLLPALASVTPSDSSSNPLMLKVVLRL
jgi:hypothetical protein